MLSANGKDAMKALLLNGALDEDAQLSALQDTVVEELKRAGAEADVVQLRKIRIAPCQGCFGCWIKTPGVCTVKDESHDIVRLLVRSDLWVFLTPVTFGGYSSELKKLLDRQICVISPFFGKFEGETHHVPRYERPARLLALGTVEKRDDELELIFKKLVYRNSLNLHNPAHAAGVFHRAMDRDRTRDEVLALLAEVGVRS
jgi:multimeric flavodoxin WrbA